MNGRRFARAAGFALVTILLLAAGGLAFVYSGAYDVRATEGHSRPVDWLLSTLRQRSIAARADEAPARPAVDAEALEHGFEHYRAMCVACHGAPGVDRGEFGQGMTPVPPDLAEAASESSAAELFEIVKHGVKLAGMPAFGPTHSDEEIWGIVAFVERLPEMGAEGYARREAEWTAARASAAGGEGSGHSHGETGHADGEPEQPHVDPPGTPPHSHTHTD